MRICSRLCGIGLAFLLSRSAWADVDVLKEEPPKGSLPRGKVVYVDDGVCPIGEVKEIIGGSEVKGIPRKVRCVKRPSFALAGASRAEDWSPWERAYDPVTRVRFIPVELWTGAAWDGTQEIRMAPAALEFGQRGDKTIKGPTVWNGIQVYERLNRDKLQLFAIREDRTGLGRVFDSRYPQFGCRGEVKFPLGEWKQGEVREYQLDCVRGKRPLRVTIEEIDFVYDGVPHSLRFHWLFMEGRGRGTDMRYVYSPLRGLVDVRGNE